jgi:hypothetical protein
MKYGLTILASVILFSSCRKEDEPTIPVVFEICPVDTSLIAEASPLGNLNPPGHTFPSDHIGFYLHGPGTVPVLAMTRGTIRQIYYNEWSDDYRIEFNHNKSVLSYFDHICCLFSAINEGASVNTGDTLGYARASLGAFDIGVVNYNKRNSFITRDRYHEFYLYYDDPYAYFTDSIRLILEHKNPRIGEPKGGKADFDRDGTLAGNWFLEGTPYTYEASSYLYGMNQLAFVYDMYNASVIRISCGGTLDTAPFSLRVTGNSPDPLTVTVQSGLIKYQLESSFTPNTLLVKMTDNRTLQVEIFVEKLPSEVDNFTTGARIYIR